MNKAWLVSPAVLVLAACAASGQFDRNAAFTESSAGSLVMFGVDIQSQFKSPSLVFRKYDPQTGRIDPKGVVHSVPRTDKMSGGQKFAAIMTGQTSRPGGHDYFVVNFPPGKWFLWSMSGFYNDGLGTSYSATSYLTEGTIAIDSVPGTASYIGEYVVRGKFGENLRIEATAPDLSKAQAELATFANVKQTLTQVAPEPTTYSCTMKRGFMGNLLCDSDSIVVGGKPQ